MTWYQYGFIAGVSITALGRFAGGWRTAILVFAVLTVAEVLLHNALVQVGSTYQWPHRTVMWVLSAGNLALVLAAFFASPLAGEATVSFGLFRPSPGSGAYLGLAAAAAGVLAAVVRLFTEPSTFRRLAR